MKHGETAGMTPRGESRPKVDKGKSPEGFRAEARACGQGNVMGDAWGRRPEGLARSDRGVVANESQGDQGSRNRSGGKYKLVQAEGEARDVVVRREGPKGLGKGSEEPRGMGDVRGVSKKHGEVDVGWGTSGRGQGTR